MSLSIIDTQLYFVKYNNETYSHPGNAFRCVW